MIDVNEIVQRAARDYGLSLRDDPTAWADGKPTWEVVQDICEAVARDNAVSELSRKLGAISEKLLEALNVESVNEGPLADLDAVFAQFVTGLSPVPSELHHLAELAKWDDQLERLRGILSACIVNQVMPTVGPTLADYVNSEPRLAHLHTTISAPEVTDGWDDDFTPPAFLSGVKAAPSAEETPPASFPVNLYELASAAGITDTTMATALGISRPYYSLVKSGKRPSFELTDLHKSRVADVVRAQAEALNKIAELVE